MKCCQISVMDYSPERPIHLNNSKKYSLFDLKNGLLEFLLVLLVQQLFPLHHVDVRLQHKYIYVRIEKLFVRSNSLYRLLSSCRYSRCRRLHRDRTREVWLMMALVDYSSLVHLHYLVFIKERIDIIQTSMIKGKSNVCPYLDLTIDSDFCASVSQLSVSFSISERSWAHLSHFGDPRSSATLFRQVINMSLMRRQRKASFRIHSTPPRTPLDAKPPALFAPAVVVWKPSAAKLQLLENYNHIRICQKREG